MLQPKRTFFGQIDSFFLIICEYLFSYLDVWPRYIIYDNIKWWSLILDGMIVLKLGELF